MKVFETLGLEGARNREGREKVGRKHRKKKDTVGRRKGEGGREEAGGGRDGEIWRRKEKIIHKEGLKKKLGTRAQQ